MYISCLCSTHTVELGDGCFGNWNDKFVKRENRLKFLTDVHLTYGKRRVVIVIVLHNKYGCTVFHTYFSRIALRFTSINRTRLICTPLTSLS